MPEVRSKPSSSASSRQGIVVLGSTGSIGTNTLDVLAHHPDRFEVIGLTCHSRCDLLLEQAGKFKPRWVGITGETSSCDWPKGTELVQGNEAIAERVQRDDVDMVVSAIVGSAGLLGTWAAIEAGKDVALANKETLVVAGSLVTELMAKTGSRLLPVDSEHSAIFQAMVGNPEAVERIVLTASGGPFRGRSAADLQNVQVEEALRHPTWKMGPKITIDSATLMNKALEIIEARWLFGLRSEQIDVIIHPESIIHSFVEFVDGSVMAQLSPPDMRLPIQYALTYPERISCPTRKLDWVKLKGLTFEVPDRDTFPALDLGLEVARQGGTAGAVLNGANEAAVAKFLDREMSFLDIPRVCRAVLNAHTFEPKPTLDGLLTADRWARQEVTRWISQNRT